MAKRNFGLRGDDQVDIWLISWTTDQGTQLDDRGADDTVSVHAYSPPLSLMNYYDLEGDRLIKLASVWTEDPEEPALALALNEAL